MSVIIGLFVLGIALIMIEVFVPGGIVGAVGGICLLIAIGVSFREHGTEGAIVALLAAGVCVVVCLVFEFKVLPKTAVGKRLFLTHKVSANSRAVAPEDSLLGKEGSAVTALAPSGYVLVEGRKLEAYSRSGFLDKGEKVRVESIDQFKVTVSKI